MTMLDVLLDDAHAARPHEFRQAASWACRRNLPLRQKKVLVRRPRRRYIDAVTSAIAEVTGDEHTARKCTHPHGRWACESPPLVPLAEARQIEVECVRFVGWLRAVQTGDYPRVARLISVARYSRTGLTSYHFCEPYVAYRASGSSPGRLDRWVRATMRRAAAILSPWQTHPSYSALGRLCEEWVIRGRLPRPHKAALILSAESLQLRYGGRQSITSRREAVTYLKSMRVRHRSGQPSPDVLLSGEVHTWLDATYGPAGDDDRLWIRYPEVVAACEAGAIVRDPIEHRDSGRIVQVVVTDPAKGSRCHLTVPAHFGRPLAEGETAAQRVHAAVAWTFSLPPEQYAPVIER